MNKYQVQFDRSADRDLDKLEDEILKRIWIKIKLLADNPRPSGCKKLAIGNNLWRIRIGDFHVIYRISDKTQTVTIAEIKNRKDAY